VSRGQRQIRTHENNWTSGCNSEDKSNFFLYRFP